MTTHIATLARKLSGHARMYGRCTCGWASAPGSSDEASAAVAAHLAEVGATAEVPR